MSSNTLMQCVAESSFEPLTFSGYRCVEDQRRSVTMDLVDSAKEHELLEQMIESVKPQVPTDCKGLDYLLATPFRYPPLLQGTRFGRTTERSLFYGSLEIETTFAEVAYYQMEFFRASEAEFNSHTKDFTCFAVSVKSIKGIDLSSEKFTRFLPNLTNLNSYHETQEIGSFLRDKGYEVFLAASARWPMGKNFGIFDPKAFNKKKSNGHRNWKASISSSRVIFSSRNDIHEYMAETFFESGDWPSLPGRS